MPSRVTDKNPHDEAIAELMKLAGKTVSTGWYEDTPNYPDGKRPADVAAYHEFGTVNMPERPVLSMSFDSRQTEYEALADLTVTAIIDGGKADQGLKVIGLKMKSDLQRDFTILNLAALAPSTIRAKGNSTPLIDTGHLLNSVSYKVRVS